jgi:hypothetical protein
VATTTAGWEAAFVAMSVALGMSVDEALASLDPLPAARVEAFARSLAHAEREARAKALAAGLARISLSIEEGRLG